MPKSELLAQQSFQPSCLVLTELLWTGLEYNPWSADYGTWHLIAPQLNHQTWAALGKVLLGITNVFRSNRLTNSSLNLCMQPATTLLTTSNSLNTCTQLNTCIPLTTFHWPHSIDHIYWPLPVRTHDQVKPAIIEATDAIMESLPVRNHDQVKPATMEATDAIMKSLPVGHYGEVKPTRLEAL